MRSTEHRVQAVPVPVVWNPELLGVQTVPVVETPKNCEYSQYTRNPQVLPVLKLPPPTARYCAYINMYNITKDKQKDRKKRGAKHRQEQARTHQHKQDLFHKKE